MLTRLPLTTRILLVILTVQALLFAALAAASIDNLRREIATETRLAAQTARSLVVATIGTMQGAVPPDRLLSRLTDQLVPPRHTRILILDPRDGMVREPAVPTESHAGAPGWFAALVTPEPLETRLPVVLEGRLRGFVYIASDPAAEIAAAWREIRTTLSLAGLAALAQSLLILIATRRALRPLDMIAGRLADLTRGDLTTRVGRMHQPDLVPLAAGVDRLAGALQQAQFDRARLQRQVVSRGDEERKSIARDLHDEMGPCLFGLRVEADALRAAAAGPDIAAQAEAIAAIAEEIARVNRALLDDLRPAAVGQLPLVTVLSDYTADLARRFPAITLDLDIASGLPEPDEATALTLFRIVQEGTTNALRHSGAGRVRIRLWTDPAHWRMILSDDGKGFAEGHREGTGLTGMRERITLLGGSLHLSSDESGTTIEASLPRTQGG
ncbi:ATP-binding protein [Paracoccus salsus]|uniref:ATP-binding protein n=1 Tax=Paracoccus salsus TaxID=2911061 RepID=UPI001F47F69B|nr:ATP-binding protein [Paracoccus salsus]MCF3974213.1 histidine kinase [Paracoccus salsus]